MATKTNDTKTTLIGFIFFIVFSLLVVGFFNGWFRSDDKSSDHKKQTTSQDTSKNETDNSFDKPVVVTQTDTVRYTPQEFVSKYKGKWVSFDGVLYGTTEVDNTMYAGVSIGDNPNDSNFKDVTTIFRIYAKKSTFSSDLQSYMNITPADKLNDFPKVHVIGMVTRYDETSDRVMLSDWGNTNGEKPSVTSRK